MQRWKKRCILQNLPEKLRSFTEGTSCVQQSLFRRKLCQSEDHISVGFGSRRSGRRRTASDDDCEECEDLGELTKIEADPKDGLFRLFGFIGMIPNTGVFADKVETDDKGYIKTDEDMHTNIPGVYAAGDVRVKSLRQVVTAVADGAIAAVQVERSMSEY